ncbi:MAG: hypothetical protein KDI28_10845 [Pseudomonadales bacterium]|nr:hypothetical protein [Pseudomonadales bacterium]MCP5359099.1 hypothetical protein [Pseudomonadales bacterium]
MSPNIPEGFSFQARKSGDVEILHFGKPAAVLRAADARKFLAKAEQADELALQHLMARVTGNYKRGNER